MPSISPNRLPSREAIIHFNGKTLLTSSSYQDVKAYEHVLAFTVAKMLDQDLLKATHDLIAKSLENGTDFSVFKQQLKPLLLKKGWLGLDDGLTDKTAIHTQNRQISRRLRAIYHTNLHTAYAAGQWTRIQKTKAFLPYLQYMPSLSENARLEHKRYYHLVRPVDDLIWQSIFPPNGFGCKCWVKQLTKSQAQQILDKQAKDGVVHHIDTDIIKNTKTGEIEQIPKGITPSFGHNHDRLTALLKLAEDKHGQAWTGNLAKDIANLIPKKLLPKPLLALVDKADDLPPPKEWRKVAKMGEELYHKHRAIFDKVDFDKPFDFSDAVRAVMNLEGVEMGGIANAYGDSVALIQEILGRYPKSWVDKANEMGKVFVRDMATRGWHLQLESQGHVNYFKQTKIPKEYAIFKKFADQMSVGDSLMKLNNLGKHDIQRLGIDVTIHEFAHRLQTAIPKLDEYFTQLWLDRTQGEKTRPLAYIQKERGEEPNYALSEVGRKDNFANVYVGKNYGTDDNPKPKEVMTMTFETLLGSGMKKYTNAEISDIKDYWQKDKELLYLGLALLLRYQP